MSIPTQVVAGLAKRRAFNFSGGSGATRGLSPVAAKQLKAFFESLGLLGAQPTLAVVEFDELSDSEVVISDTACKLYGVYMSKDTTTLSFSKLTDHASTASDAASEFRWPQDAAKDEFHAYPRGFALASGATMQGTTTANGGTGSSSNGARGFCLIGEA
jgi:hypothetical protein